MIRRDYSNVSIEYDREANAVYIYTEPYKHGPDDYAAETHHLIDNVHIDIGPNGSVVGVEILL